MSDVTAVYTGTGWLYLAVMLDLFSRTVVGWATSASNDTALGVARRLNLHWPRALQRSFLHWSRDPSVPDAKR